MNKNILITGGSGFIGSRLALKLLEKGYVVSVLDCLSSQIHGNCPSKTSPLFISIKDKVRFFLGDVRDRHAWVNALPDIDCIVHLAAETGTGQSMYDIEKYINTNIGGTALMLDILINTVHKVKKVIVAESRAIYGEGKYFSDELNQNVYPESREVKDMEHGEFEVTYTGCKNKLKPVATDESSAIHPTSVYGITKQVQGQLVHLICPTIGIDSVSYRYQNVYGPGQSLSNPYTGILSVFSTIIKNGNTINIFEDGQESRDFVYIDDVVDATILGIEKKEAAGHVFNVGSGVPVDVLTVVETLMDKYKTKVPYTISGNFRLGDIRHNFADITKIRQILGFEPKWNFDEGITEFVNWVNKQDVKQDKYNESITEMRSKGLYK
jgi:dTDP-L-rhamnose 4-epimerase